MKKKRAIHHKRSVSRVARNTHPKESFFIIVRSWMLLVMFALMLGLGAVVGTYLNNQSATPTVAGVQVEAR